MTASISLRTIAASVFLLAALAPSRAQSPKPIELIVFPGGFNWPVWVAEEKGLFARNGVAVNVTPTPGSAFQLTSLIDGKFDIAITAIDNVIAYSEGQGAAPTKEMPDLVAFMGGDNGFLRLVAVPEVKTYADLKAKQISVDALTTGYAFVLQEMLAKGGLQPTDYELVPAGGVLQRFQALMEKKHAATLLISPFEVNAEAKGFTRLANADDVLGAYQGLVGATRRAWAREREKDLVGYIRAYLAALDWLYAPSNRAEAVAILRKNIPATTEDLAQRSYDILVHPQRGFARRAELDIPGIKTVLALRSKYAQPSKQLADPAKYYDLQYYAKAQ
jgi:ABC-type nitrate/sulfonate/bicarbonate transport system substrate-binding protein